MSTTPPPRSPIKESATQQDEDGDEVMSTTPNREEAGANKALSDRSSPPPTQIKVQPQSQIRGQTEPLATKPIWVTVAGPTRLITPARAASPAALAASASIDHQRNQTRTPDLKQKRSQRAEPESPPRTPGNLAPFDWEDFDSRYQKALAEADEHEMELLRDFEDLVKYFNVWATASSAHDSERAVKRLQTRQRYVHLAEQNLEQKKQHLVEVVKAFQSALALLSAA